jgi:5-methylthioadenosine/S-adenosylhomocysteine deaminase
MSRSAVIGNPVVTLQTGDRPIPEGAVVVENDRIVDIGTQSAILAASGFDAIIGSNDHIVMPGLFNCHLHGENACARGLYDSVWEKANVWVHEDIAGLIDEDDLFYMLLWGYLRSVKSGTTGILDFFYGRPYLGDFGADVSISAQRRAGIRGALALATRDRRRYMHRDDDVVLAALPPGLRRLIESSPVGYAYPVESVFATFRAMFERYHQAGGPTHIMLAPDWGPACSDALLDANRRLASEFDTTLQIHLLETPYEMLETTLREGKSTVRRLYDLGFLGPDVSGAHCVWPTDDDIRILADTGVIISTQPGSNLRLASGISPVRDMLAAGVRIAIGSDGISMEDDNSLLTEVRLSGLLQRLPRSEPGRVSSETLLRAATVNGPKAAGWTDVGELAKGAQADLILLDKREFCWPPQRFAETDILDVIVDRAQGHHVATTIVAGRVLMQDRVLTEWNEEWLRTRVEEASERVFRVPAEFLELRPAVEALHEMVMQSCAGWANARLTGRHTYNIAHPPPQLGQP